MRPTISIVVPVFREVENIPVLIRRVEQVALAEGLTVELVIVDDKSEDGSREAVAEMNRPWVRFKEREGPRDLSLAVVDGLRMARHDVLVVMDGDLSNPPESIPALVDALTAGNDFAIGSRFVSGAAVDDDWGVGRWTNALGARLLARPFTSVSDPLNGFFALSRRLFEKADPLRPIGYKIGLELMVKCGVQKAAEIPIPYENRRHGRSKLNLRQRWNYIRHLSRLAAYCCRRALRPGSSLRHDLPVAMKRTSRRASR